ncbi:hypothetical protein ULMS_22960 [Patiriisocius marinistellae]|uniref:Macroglobulin domain-containing protein n=1 Tax=Patiriisocius marinistellae TaxID=2494560 RepID=A0A5J4FZD7_9FLAO|nr:hypothetical protein [Patiriisocius marinistellae]GEQ86788.1 hypothetical protein ULMS_22960 [Patiriisocius marinistellae]
MKNKILYIFFLLATFFSSNSQNTPTNTTAQEEIFVHINSSLLFSGEYLYYKLYCLNAQTHQKTKLSNIVYVDFVDSNGKTVFNHKIVLEDGLGNSDFFVPSTIASGSYKLVAYTQWMQNNPVDKFFETSLKIINPYIAEINNTQEIESIAFPKSASQQDKNLKLPEDLNIQIILDKKQLSIREKINIIIQNNMGPLGNGDYSMSVRKLDDIEGFPRKTATQAMSKKEGVNIIFMGNSNQKAETDGYLLKGEVIKRISKLPAQSVDVAVSIPGENFLFTVVTTNAAGEFSFEIDPNFQGEQAIIQILEDKKEDYEINLQDEKYLDYSKLDFPKFSIDKSFKDKIVERSIYNQIENGYYNLKPDTIEEKQSALSFVRYEKGITYELDDYTRFNTMKEVLTEIVKLAWTTTENNKRVVKVLEREMSAPTKFLPLLFVDGVFMEDHEEFLNINALQVKDIKIIRKGYYFGENEYQGVVVVNTKKGNFIPSEFSTSLIQKTLFLPQPSKRYFSQTYNKGAAEVNKRIPDYRLQLMWNPMINLTMRETHAILYSSDIPGIYEIVVEGYTNHGVPISLRETFEVIDSINKE